ncbi:lytic transglycosylase domain-containing protein [Allosphingosinicella sp.]|jgi:soluble lytic murein transglycosylase|uniref:lytic transglycosylase domain-containing protein n=1 Tax=Allosphingosinicella sp. TaxID=2823234 RepID=UPI002F156B8E
MQKRVLAIALLGATGAAVAAGTLGTIPLPKLAVKLPSLALGPVAGTVQQPFVPRPAVPLPAIAGDIARWHSLRQSDNLPFSSYASFLTAHRGWPGEDGLRRTAERQIESGGASASEVLRYFSVFPPLTPTGEAHFALALLAGGDSSQAGAQARKAWLSGAMTQTVESRLLGAFGPAFGQADHDSRMDVLLDERDLQSARRLLPMTSLGRRPLYEARIALQTRAPDAASRVTSLGGSGAGDVGLVMDQANWLRNSGQSKASRDFLASPRPLTRRPRDAEKYLETLLTMARGAAADREWSVAYAIASRADDAFPAGTDVTARSTGERDDYTSLVWLAGTTALQKLNRPADAVTMFTRYASGGRSLQVLTKGRYWAGRAAAAAGRTAEATAHFEAAARYPELFYAQLALDRLGRPVPAPPAPALQPTQAERLAFQHRSLVEATRYLGQAGRWSDQSLFVRSLSEAVDGDRDRLLASELSRQIGRPDLAVWVARSARNSGSPYYLRSAYPQVDIPPAQSHYWSLAHGIIRQESSFDRAAVSHAGARGLMQLMPATAREVAGRMGLPYGFDRLTSDPAYNVSLGTSYLATMMDMWGGNIVLTAASYNAGAGNVRRWIRENGDPRMPNVDVLEWIEAIPFTETRGYVQRVIENAVVYDAANPQRATSPERNRVSWYLGRPGRAG